MWSAPGTGQRGGFKGHAEQPFWQWVASWARAIRRPSDLGYPDHGYHLPPLHHRTHMVQAPDPDPTDPDPTGEGLLPLAARGLRQERAESRATLTRRCETAAAALADAPTAVAWCHLNDESRLLARLIDGAVEVTGTDTPEAKEDKLTAFGRGQIRVLVIKPRIGAWGLNWQHCHRMTWFPTHSYEQYYQAVRRSWRFGQPHPVTVDLITTPGGARALTNLHRKAAQAARMFDALTTHMRDAAPAAPHIGYDTPVEVPPWAS